MPSPILEWEKRLGRRLTLRDLHILKTVAQSGSMAKAARSLGMSQPSVSEAIAKLEAALRVRLLDRGPRAKSGQRSIRMRCFGASKSSPMNCSRAFVTSSFLRILLPERCGSDAPKTLHADLSRPSLTECRCAIRELRSMSLRWNRPRWDFGSCANAVLIS